MAMPCVHWGKSFADDRSSLLMTAFFSPVVRTIAEENMRMVEMVHYTNGPYVWTIHADNKHQSCTPNA